jgi:chromosome segregation ATPase
MDDEGTAQAAETEQLKNNAADEAERLRKEAEQAKMRANQLANELEARKKADEEAKAQKLKEDEKYRELYEQTQAKLAAREDAEAKAKEQEAAKSKLAEVHQDFSKEVLEVAEAAGVTLTGVSDADVSDYRSRLEAIASKVAPTSSPVRGNNPVPRTDTAPEKQKLLDGMKVGHKESTFEYISSLPALKEMRRMAGVEVKE